MDYFIIFILILIYFYIYLIKSSSTSLTNDPLVEPVTQWPDILAKSITGSSLITMIIIIIQASKTISSLVVNVIHKWIPFIGWYEVWIFIFENYILKNIIIKNSFFMYKFFGAFSRYIKFSRIYCSFPKIPLAIRLRPTAGSGSMVEG